MKQPACVVIGTSAGGIKALTTLLPLLSSSITCPICIVQHMKAGTHHYLVDILANVCSVPVIEVEDATPIQASHIYIAPADYHLLIEDKTQLTLSVDEPLHHSRPSVDILFESAADAFGTTLLGIILTGMGVDGAKGLQKIMHAGGQGLIQDIDEAEFSDMPTAALASTPNAKLLTLRQIHDYMMRKV